MSLINPKDKIAKRKCLRCDKTFKSLGFSNRICSRCAGLRTNYTGEGDSEDVYDLPSSRLIDFHGFRREGRKHE